MEPFWFGVIGGVIIGTLLVIEQRTAKARKRAREIKKRKKASLTFRDNQNPQRILIEIVTDKGYESITLNMSMDRFVMHLKALSKMHRND